MRTLVLGLVAMGLLAGCGKSGGGDGKPGSSGAAAQGSADSLVTVDLKPLPLQIKVAPGGLGAMDMSIGGAKSVTVDIGGGEALNISEADKDFAAEKKSYQGDTVLFPFKKWAKETPNMAVVQFENDGKTGFIGFTQKEIGGKKYVCKTTGLDGIASAELAEKHLKTCDAITAK